MVENPHKIVPTALNIGIMASKGDVIIRMDAHTYYDKNYISKCLETLEKIDADNVGGPIFTLPGDNTLIAEAIALATSHPFGVGNSKFRTSNKAQYVDTVTFGAFKREIFEKVGLFNEKLIRNQDIELNSRIKKIGGRIFLNPEIKSYYYNQSNLRGLWRQGFKTGMWNIFTKGVNKSSLSIRHFVPLFFILSLISSITLCLIHPIGIYLLSIIVGSYLISSALFSIKIGFKHNLRAIPLLLIVFVTLHFSYGWGSIIGIFKLRHWQEKIEK